MAAGARTPREFELPPQAQASRPAGGRPSPARLGAAAPAARAAPSTPRAPVQRAARSAAAANTASEGTPGGGRLLTSGWLWMVLLVVVLYFGWSFPTERYITPTRGFGYALGIVGGSLMLVLLLYSARKHFEWLRFLGPTPAWFRFHMVLGVIGPLCILFHSNFRTGATNSNVALFAMLAVAGSGFIGRYFYAHIHQGLYGRKLELGELQAGAAGLRALSGGVSFLPDLVGRLDAAERRLLACGPHISLFGFLKPVVVGCATVKARWQLHGYVRRALRTAARNSPAIATQARRLKRAARAYVDRRLAATRRVAEFEGYERLFSLWHALHVPLIFMLIIAAVIHVIAVNVY